MSDIIKTTLREPDEPEPRHSELLQQIVEEFKDAGKTIRDASKKICSCKG